MKQVSHYDKVMWGLYCEYSYIPCDVWYTKETIWRWEWDEEAKRNHNVNRGTRRVEHTKRSAKQWSFIHSKYHYITKIDPIYDGSLENFKNYLEFKTRGGRHRSSPYKKYKSFGFWRRRPEGQDSYKKQPHHKKKELSEDTVRRREWRNKIKDRRNQGRRFYNETGWTVLQRDCNRKGRRRVKQKMFQEDWDNWSHPLRREELNPWDYY